MLRFDRVIWAAAEKRSAPSDVLLQETTRRAALVVTVVTDPLPPSMAEQVTACEIEKG